MLQRGFGKGEAAVPADEDETMATAAQAAAGSTVARSTTELHNISVAMEQWGRMRHAYEVSKLERMTARADVPFTVPFNTDKYVGSISDRHGSSGAVAYFRADSKRIYVAMASNSAYVALGMSKEGPAMGASDIALCRQEGSEVVAEDYHAAFQGKAQKDGVQHWTIGRGAKEADGVIWCEVSRPLLTCESEEDVQVEDLAESLYGLLAWAKPGQEGDQLSYHEITNPQVKVFKFGNPKTPTIEDDAESYTIDVPPVYVPQQQGSYVCTLHKLPFTTFDKVHIVHYKKNTDYTAASFKTNMQHHITLFRCSTSTKPIEDKYLSDKGFFGCTLKMKDCNTPMFVVSDMYYPEGAYTAQDTGIPAGGEDGIWVVAERHFYNSRLQGGVLDIGQNFVFQYTRQLRPKAQRTTIMATNTIQIPPKTQNFALESWCPGGCTQRMGDETDLLHVDFHMHGYGRKASLRMIRDGKEQAPIATVQPWDQASSSVSIARTVRAGDTLILECTYTNNGGFMVTYGDGAGHEMCSVTVTYAGVNPMQLCFDMPGGLASLGHTPHPYCFNPDGSIKKDLDWCDLNRPLASCPMGNETKDADKVVYYSRDMPYQPYQKSAGCKEPEPEPEGGWPEPEPEGEWPEPEPEKGEPEPEPEHEEPEPEPEHEEPEPEPEHEEPEPEPEHEEPEPEHEEPEPEPENMPTPAPSGCSICKAGTVLDADKTAGWANGGAYSCQDAQDWLNSDSATASCTQGTSWWGSTCCKQGTAPPPAPQPAPPPPTPSPGPAGCSICKAGTVLNTDKTAGWSSGHAYTCQNAQDWLNSASATASCAQGTSWWSSTCCKTAPTPKPPAPMPPAPQPAPPPATPSPTPLPTPLPTPSPTPSPTPLPTMPPTQPPTMPPTQPPGPPATPKPAPAPVPEDCSFCESGYKLRKRRAAWRRAKKNGKKYTCEMAEKDQKDGVSGLTCAAAKAKYTSWCCKKKRVRSKKTKNR